MALYDESGAIDKTIGKRVVVERTWQFLRETPGVIGSWLAQRPLPLKQSEIDAILSNKPAEAEEKPPKKKKQKSEGGRKTISPTEFEVMCRDMDRLINELEGVG